ncbi:MAG TPA: hypothetical protein VF749_14020 [Candidatus Acidoferrum sp.]
MLCRDESAQRAKAAWMDLIDERVGRYPPDEDPLAVPFNVLLQPRESVTTWRNFHAADNVRELGPISGHGGSCCG